MSPSGRQLQRSPGERGHTLIELLVAATIAGLIGTLMLSVWTFTLSLARRGSRQVEAQQIGRIALSTIVRELREAAAGTDMIALWSITDGAPVNAVGFLSARQEEGGRPFIADRYGDPSWRTAVYYVHDRSREVLRRVARPWEGSLVLPEADQGRVVARDVKDVRFARQGELVLITLRISTSRAEITLETAVQPRN